MQTARELNLSAAPWHSTNRDEARETTTDAGALSNFDIRRLLPQRASKRGLLLVFRQLALLVETGVDVSEALDLVASSCRSPRLQESLEEIHDDISNGTSLSSAIMSQSQVIGHQIAASIQAGEASGRLVEVLRQIADQLEDDLRMRSTIAGSIAYPCILCTASIGVALILIWFVLPQFEQSFASMAVDPPIFTQYLIKSAGLIRSNVVALVIGLIMLSVGGTIAAMQPSTRTLFSNLCFFSPILGPPLRNLAIGQLFMSLGHLLHNGISLLEAIQLMRKGVHDGATRQLIEVWENDVLEGRGLSHSLDQFDFLPDGADAMLIMAERTGKLEMVLTTAGAHYRSEGTTRLHQVLKLSEPLIIILLGIFVGVVVASVLLPMLDVQSAGAAK